MPRRWKYFLIITLVCLFADQATKVWARETLPTHPANCDVPDDILARKCFVRSVSVIDGYWDWQLSFNPGASFSLFRGQAGARVFLSVLALAAVGGMAWMVRKAREDQRALIWALGLVAGGALGNAIDRIRFGVVTDFIHWHWKSHDWPIFNVADITLMLGVGLMFVDILGEAKRKREVEPAPREA
jgi:signal peptidase II